MGVLFCLQGVALDSIIHPNQKKTGADRLPFCVNERILYISYSLSVLLDFAFATALLNASSSSEKKDENAVAS